MCSDVAIRVQGLTKRYHIYSQPADRLKQMLWRGRRRFYDEFTAVSDVTFGVKRGQTVGIVGKNGSGKSTLLQLICGTVAPSAGTVEVRGRLSALLELGAGFDPDMSGRENVYIYASILGLNGSEIDQHYNDIVAFADIGKFIDQPVKTYSSGMCIRLAFAVAIHVEPEILVVDEALAVGDASFQYKCIKKIEKMQQGGVTILVVTHDVGTVKKLCTRAIWLHQGRLVSDGNAVAVADLYQDFIRSESFAIADGRVANESAPEVSVVQETAGIASAGRINGVIVRDERGGAVTNVVLGDTITIIVTYELYRDLPEGVIVGAAIFRSDDVYVCGLNTALDAVKMPSDAGIHGVSLVIERMPLLSGSFYIKVGLFDKSGMVIWDFHDRAMQFQVTSPYIAEGLAVLDHRWELTP